MDTKKKDEGIMIGTFGDGKDFQHKFIILSDKYKEGNLPLVVKELLSDYLPSIKKTMKEWKRDKSYYSISYKNEKGGQEKSKSFNYRILSDSIRKNQVFVREEFNLPDTSCMWLDISVNFKHGYDLDQGLNINVTDGTPQKQYGENYPIKPVIDREGQVLTTLQPQMMRRVMSARYKLIESSNKALTDEWFLDLRSLINDTISLLEITLSQLYIKAMYDPLPGWEFDKSALGDKHGRRLNDKIKWVNQITGKNLNIEPERKSFDNLREIRNHLNHFDPPSIVITLEEATEWLNQILDIGMILFKIRKTIGAEVSRQLLNFLLQKEAVFKPYISIKKRTKLNSEKAGYKTSVWKNQ